MSKKANLQIVVKLSSAHTMPIPKGMHDLVSGLFHAAGLTGSFQIDVGEIIKGSAHSKGIKVVGILNTRDIYFKAQPGGNDTNHKLIFHVPDGLDVNQVFNALRGASDHRSALIQWSRAEKKMSRLYRLTHGCAFSLGDLEDVFAELGFNSLASLGQALADFVRKKIFVLQEQKEDKFSWTAEFHQTMKENGYDPAEMEARDSVSGSDEAEDEEDEEDKIIVRIYGIDDRLVDIDELVALAESELQEIGAKLSVVQKELNVLLAQVEKANLNLGSLRKSEDTLITKISILSDEKIALVQEKNDLVRCAEELDQEKKLERVKREAESVISVLSPEERMMLINRLQSAVGGM